MVRSVRCESNEAMRSIRDQLRVKRYETPQDGYMDDIVKEFHRRQRVAARRARPADFAGLLTQCLREVTAAKWICAAVMGYACFMTWLLVTPSVEDKQRGALPKRVYNPLPEILKPAKQFKRDGEKPDKKDAPVKTVAPHPF